MCGGGGGGNGGGGCAMYMKVARFEPWQCPHVEVICILSLRANVVCVSVGGLYLFIEVVCTCA